jgi:hypothetical protein
MVIYSYAMSRHLDNFPGINYHATEKEEVMAGRPTKEPGEKMDIPLRIMLTSSQNDLIRQAAGGDVSGWARPILLQAARKQLGEAERHKRPKRP